MSGPELARLLAEIDEQPQVVARLLDNQRAAVHAVARTIRERQPSTIVLVARGSSDNAAVYGRYLLEVCNRRLTSLAAPSGLTLYGRGRAKTWSRTCVRRAPRARRRSPSSTMSGRHLPMLPRPCSLAWPDRSSACRPPRRSLPR